MAILMILYQFKYICCTHSFTVYSLRMTVFVIVKQQVNRHALSLVTFMTCSCFFRACDDDGYVW